MQLVNSGIENPKTAEKSKILELWQLAKKDSDKIYGSDPKTSFDEEIVEFLKIYS